MPEADPAIFKLGPASAPPPANGAAPPPANGAAPPPPVSTGQGADPGVFTLGPASATPAGGAPPPTAPTQSPDMLSGLAQEGIQGLTFGAGDKIAAYADALYDTYLGDNNLQGKTISEKAANAQQHYQQLEQAFEKSHPYMANIAKFGGMGLSALAMPELGLAKLGAAGTGALAGAAEGWGNAPISGSTGSSLARTLLGAGLGAGGGYLGGKAAGTLGDLLSVPAAGAPYAAATRAAYSGAGPIAGPLAKGGTNLATMFALKHMGVPDFVADMMGWGAREPLWEGAKNIVGLVRKLPSLSVAGAPVGATAASAGPSALAHAILLGSAANQARGMF